MPMARSLFTMPTHSSNVSLFLILGLCRSVASMMIAYDSLYTASASAKRPFPLLVSSLSPSLLLPPWLHS